MKPASVNTIFFISGIAMLIASSLVHVNFLNYKAPIPYPNWEQIRWSDFRGNKPPLMTLMGTFEFAFISTEIRVSRNDAGQLEVNTLFHPARSYVYNQNVMQKSLLRHELYHLHITEYAARQLRQKLTEAPPASSEDLQNLEANFQYLERELQSSYDGETEHGFRLGNQKRWEARIDSSLQVLSKYSNPNIP